jgi:hypothetical protein
VGWEGRSGVGKGAACVKNNTGMKKTSKQRRWPCVGSTIRRRKDACEAQKRKRNKKLQELERVERSYPATIIRTFAPPSLFHVCMISLVAFTITITPATRLQARQGSASSPCLAADAGGVGAHCPTFTAEKDQDQKSMHRHLASPFHTVLHRRCCRAPAAATVLRILLGRVARRVLPSDAGCSQGLGVALFDFRYLCPEQVATSVCREGVEFV